MARYFVSNVAKLPIAILFATVFFATIVTKPVAPVVREPNPHVSQLDVLTAAIQWQCMLPAICLMCAFIVNRAPGRGRP